MRPVSHCGLGKRDGCALDRSSTEDVDERGQVLMDASLCALAVGNTLGDMAEFCSVRSVRFPEGGRETTGPCVSRRDVGVIAGGFVEENAVELPLLRSLPSLSDVSLSFSSLRRSSSARRDPSLGWTVRAPDRSVFSNASSSEAPTVGA